MACFLAEWYRSEFSDPAFTKFVAALQTCASDASTHESPTRLLMVLSVSVDDVIYALFAARTAEDVLRVCTRAGALPQRLTPDVDARIMSNTPLGGG